MVYGCPAFRGLCEGRGGSAITAIICKSPPCPSKSGRDKAGRPLGEQRSRDGYKIVYIAGHVQPSDWRIYAYLVMPEHVDLLVREPV
jgi:hypothetical protein